MCWGIQIYPLNKIYMCCTLEIPNGYRWREFCSHKNQEQHLRHKLAIRKGVTSIIGWRLINGHIYLHKNRQSLQIYVRNLFKYLSKRSPANFRSERSGWKWTTLTTLSYKMLKCPYCRQCIPRSLFGFQITPSRSSVTLEFWHQNKWITLRFLPPWANSFSLTTTAYPR